MKPDHRDGPTQAQIEAAAKALAEENGDPFDELSMEKYRGDAKAALTAAAQVAAEDIRSLSLR